MASHTKIYFLREQKINRVTNLPHHDNFCRRHRITSFMKNSIPTLGSQWSPSPPHHLQQSCCFDGSILHYCARHCTIVTMVFLFRYSHHDRKRGRSDCSECKWIVIMILSHGSMSSSLFILVISSVGWSGCFCGNCSLASHQMWQSTRYGRMSSWQGRVLAAGIAMIVWLSTGGKSEWHPSEDGTDVDKVVVGRRDRNTGHYQVMQIFTNELII